MNDQNLHISLPAGYSDTHAIVTLKYLVEGRGALSKAEWQIALSGFDMLHRAVIKTETSYLTFREVYQKYVDNPLADPYIAELLHLRSVALNIKLYVPALPVLSYED